MVKKAAKRKQPELSPEIEVDQMVDLHEEEEEEEESNHGGEERIDTTSDYLSKGQAQLKVAQFKRLSKYKHPDLRKGHSLLVLPDGMTNYSDESVLWKGKIEDIRRDEKRKLFWYAIRWYYNAEQSYDLKVKTGSAFQPTVVCGPHELIDTNHFDVVSEENVVKQFDVKKLTDSADQEFIGAEEFYTRATFDVKRDSFKFSTSACPQCKKHQVTESKKTAQIQHYCPSCVKWFHRNCLHEGSDGDADILLEHLFGAESVGPARKTTRKSLNGSKSPSKLNIGTSKSAQTLRQIAGAQIIRGGEYGVSGYVQAISRARNLVKAIQIGDREMEDISLEVELGEEVLKASKKWLKSFDLYKCPACQTWV